MFFLPFNSDDESSLIIAFILYYFAQNASLEYKNIILTRNNTVMFNVIRFGELKKLYDIIMTIIIDLVFRKVLEK